MAVYELCFICVCLIANSFGQMPCQMGFSSCQEIYESGQTNSGVYDICFEYQLHTVYCEMVFNAGWTMIMRNGMNFLSDTQPPFDRNWTAFRDGFGNRSQGHAHWLGNELLYQITKSTAQRLLVKVVHNPDLLCESEPNVTKFSFYDEFFVEPESNYYALHVSGFDGTQSNMSNVLNCRLPDHFSYDGRQQLDNNGRRFSTLEPSRDFDDWSWASCASVFKAGFWHNDCGAAKFTEQDPSYLNCDYLRWHFDSSQIAMMMSPSASPAATTTQPPHADQADAQPQFRGGGLSIIYTNG